MFMIQLAEIPIAINNQYTLIEKQCKNYIVTNVIPEFMITVTKEELEAEQTLSLDEYSAGYYESTCVYRKICEHLLNYRVFLVHASVIAVDGKAYVFAAKSGTGKSTHTSLWMEHFGERAEMINGDKPLFRYIDHTFYVYGTPWCGKEGLESNRKVPVEAFCFLERGKDNRIRKIRNDEIISRIFHQLLLSKTQPQLGIFLGLIDRLIKDIPFYLLQCNISNEAVVIAYEEMKERSGVVW